jgi:hypothetical protein
LDELEATIFVFIKNKKISRFTSSKAEPLFITNHALILPFKQAIHHVMALPNII